MASISGGASKPLARVRGLPTPRNAPRSPVRGAPFGFIFVPVFTRAVILLVTARVTDNLVPHRRYPPHGS